MCCDTFSLFIPLPIALPSPISLPHHLPHHPLHCPLRPSCHSCWSSSSLQVDPIVLLPHIFSLTLSSPSHHFLNCSSLSFMVCNARMQPLSEYGLFHLMRWSPGPSISLQMSWFHFSFWLGTIPLTMHTMFSLTIHLLMTQLRLVQFSCHGSVQVTSVFSWLSFGRWMCLGI